MGEKKTLVESEINKDNARKKSYPNEVVATPTVPEDLEIQDIEGVGPTTAKKLKEAGIVSVMDLAVTSAEELAVDINTSKETAASFIMAAQKLLRDSNIIEKEFVTADAALEKRKSMLRCSTGSVALDELLLGGIETQAITEFYGEFGSGKSQICHTLCVTARQPIDPSSSSSSSAAAAAITESESELHNVKGIHDDDDDDENDNNTDNKRINHGLDSGTIYIDTEGTFRPERIEQIARARSLDASHVLKSVAVCKVYNSSHLELIIKDLGKYINDFKAKLVIIDSIISLHRAEFAGRGTLADRQQRLNGMLHKILRLAEIYNVAVVLTNQVQSSPDTFFGDPTKAAGGNVLGHASTYRIYLKKSGENRIARMIDSPYHPYSDARFTINEKGTDDIEEERKRN
ncbi:MAG TPA: helix-hairpin-helix domain-containing protein [Nitrososphaeraceae archaeon]|nr:helix-hairpin-helix domain-containing protein [Nitrososphaeraceae archaeon]